MQGTGVRKVRDIPVCESPGAATAVRSYIRAARSLIMKKLGEDSVVALAVSGSATTGEFTAVDTAGGPLLLSDVDLSLIAASDAQRNAIKQVRPSLLKKMDAIEEAARMCAPSDLGVYSPGDLRAQARKMGVLEMRTSGMVIWGDGDALLGLPDFGPDEIAKEEALTLLYNRCFELLEAGGALGQESPREAIALIYSGAKAFLDAGTALAAYHGRYVTGYRRRLDVVEELVRERYGDGVGPMSGAEFLDRLRFWTDFKTVGDLAAVVAEFGGSARESGIGRVAERTWHGARVPLAAVWIALSEIPRKRSGGGVVETCRSLLRAEPAIGRIRGWKRLLRAGEVPLSRAVKLSRFGSPVHLLRLSALCVLDGLGRREDAGTLRGDTVEFLEEYYPANGPEGRERENAEFWRGLVAGTWRSWTQRFWS
jgi:hypothetical protein